MTDQIIAFLTTPFWLTVAGIHLAAQMATSVFLYRFQSVQITSLCQILIVGIYVYAFMQVGWPAVVAGAAQYVIFLLICNRIVFATMKNKPGGLLK